MYAIRVTRPYLALTNLVNVLSEQSEKIIVYEHKDGGVKAHIHALIVGYKMVDKTLRRTIVRYLNIEEQVTNGSYSTKKADSEDFITYMSKGKYEPSYVKGFSEEEITKYKGGWIDHRQERKGVVKNLSEQKKTQKDLMEEMIKTFHQMRTDNPDDLDCDLHIKAVIKVLKKERVVTSMYKIRDFVNSVDLHSSDKESYFHRIKAFIYK